MPKISLLLADVDGTLVTEQKILTDRAKAAVAALGQKGIKFAVTSGRPPRGMQMLVEPLKITTPLAGFNGGVFVKPDMSVVATRTIAPDAAREAIKLIEGHGLDVWLYTGTTWFVHRKDAPHVARETWTVKFEPQVVDAYADKDIDQAVKIVGVSDDHDRVAKCEALVGDSLGERVSAKRSQSYYLDVTHPLANKGAVVDELVKQLGVPAQEIATIGDMPNDVLMFKKSGFSIAMGNASDEVKKQASVVTDGFNDEGFANAVERYLLDGDAA